MTQEEFDSLVQRVTNALQGSSNMATDLRVVKSPIGVNLLPGILSGELVTLEAASLMGTDGKTPLFEVGAISSGLEADASITLSGTDPSGNPIYKIGLVLPKGDSGKNPILEFKGISTGEPDTDATASFKENGTTEDGQPKYKLSLTIPRGSKGDKGNDGKTPVMEAGSVSKGLEPSVSIIPNGDDPLGNPKYKIDLVLPQGDAGKNPILEFSEIVTGAAGSEASAVFTPVGQTPEGNPKYLLKLTIPRGDTGLPGKGSGNVSVNGSDLIRGKQYLFVPSSGGSTEGSFVEYIPFNDAELKEEIGRNLQLAKTYTNEQIAGIVQFDIQVVFVLPETGKKGVIYLVPKEGSTIDTHNEYIWIESINDYELIGTTEVDLSNYYTKTQSLQMFATKEEALSKAILDISVLFDAEGGLIGTFDSAFATNFRTAVSRNVSAVLLNGVVLPCEFSLSGNTGGMYISQNSMVQAGRMNVESRRFELDLSGLTATSLNMKVLLRNDFSDNRYFLSGTGEYLAIKKYNPVVFGNPLLYKSLSNTANPVELDSFLNGVTVADVDAAIQDSQPFIFLLLGSGYGAGYMRATSVEKYTDGGTYYVFTLEKMWGGVSPNRDGITSYRLRLTANEGVFTNLMLRGTQIGGQYQAVTADTVYFSGGLSNVFLYDSDASPINIPITCPWYYPMQNATTTVIIRNTGNNEKTFTLSLADSAKDDNSGLLLTGELPAIPGKNEIELNILWANYMYIVRASEPYDYTAYTQ